MKKQTLIITAALLTLCMAGCAQQNTKPAETTTETTTAAAAAAPETTTTTTAATTTAAPEPAISPKEDLEKQEHLFRGYVDSSSSEPEQLSKAPSDDAEKFDELTYGTIMEIYTCDTDGWYLAVLGGDTVGYIKADLIKEWPHTLPFGERLFGGYINSEEPVDLLSDADESSESIRKILPGTQIDVYESDYEGWYMTEFANDSDGFDIGFIKAEYIAEIPAYDEGAYEPRVSDIAGSWIYEERDAGNTEEYVGRPVGYYTITEDGRFSYTTDGTSFTNGTINVVYEQYSDGSMVPWFMFYTESGESFMGCHPAGEDGCLYIGNAGESRLVPDNGNAIGGTDNFSVPNEYGFYEYKNPPASSVSVASLSGTWCIEGNPSEVLSISRTDDIYKGTFKFEGSSTATGVIKLEYLLNPDNTQTFWFTFYTVDGQLWNGFSVTGDVPLNDLYSGQDGAIHFVRIGDADIYNIAGVWYEADVLDSRTLTINEDGSYTLAYRGGGAAYGTVKIEYEEHPDGSLTAWYNLYEDDGKLFAGFQKTDEFPQDNLYSGHDGEMHFERAYL